MVGYGDFFFLLKELFKKIIWIKRLELCITMGKIVSPV